MRNLIITALTAFSFITSPVLAGDRSFDMENAFAYTKSTQSAGSGGSAGSAGSAASSGAATTAIVVGLGILILVLIAVSASDGDGGTYSGSST